MNTPNTKTNGTISPIFEPKTAATVTTPFTKIEPGLAPKPPMVAAAIPPAANQGAGTQAATVPAPEAPKPPLAAAKGDDDAMSQPQKSS